MHYSEAFWKYRATARWENKVRASSVPRICVQVPSRTLIWQSQSRSRLLWRRTDPNHQPVVWSVLFVFSSAEATKFHMYVYVAINWSVCYTQKLSLIGLHLVYYKFGTSLLGCIGLDSTETTSFRMCAPASDTLFAWFPPYGSVSSLWQSPLLTARPQRFHMSEKAWLVLHRRVSQKSFEF